MLSLIFIGEAYHMVTWEHLMLYFQSLFHDLTWSQLMLYISNMLIWASAFDFNFWKAVLMKTSILRMMTLIASGSQSLLVCLSCIIGYPAARQYSCLISRPLWFENSDLNLSDNDDVRTKTSQSDSTDRSATVFDMHKLPDSNEPQGSSDPASIKKSAIHRNTLAFLSRKTLEELRPTYR